jgi:hypothetical protein
MKRTTTKIILKSRGKDPSDPEINKAYKVYNDDDELKKQLVDPNNQWAVYPNQYYSPEQKNEVEFYLCGWLQYYDEIIRGNSVDHYIHFQWSDKNVEVYTYPAPDRTPLSPKKVGTPPSTTSDPKSPTAPPPPYP